MKADSTLAPVREPLDLPGLCLAYAEHSPLPMAAVEGVSHIVRYVNPAFCSLMDKSRQQLLGKPFAEMFPEDSDCLSMLTRVLNTGTAETHVQQRDLKPQPVFWSCTLWPVLSGVDPVGIVIQVTQTAQFHTQTVAMNEALTLGMVHQNELTDAAESLNVRLQNEMAERKQVEKALRDNAWRLRYATESARLTFVEIDFVNGVARTPENFADVMGYGPPTEQQASVGAGALLEHVVAVDRQRVSAALQEFFGGQSVGKLDYRVLGDDQIERWIETRWSTKCDADDRPLTSFATNIDITERKQAEKAMRHSEERLRALMTASSDVVYQMSPDWSQMRQLHGQGFVADTTAVNPNWLQQYIHPDDQPHVLAVINDAIRSKSLFELEHQVVAADGSLGWIFSRAVPMLDANGEIVEWFGTASDVTEQKRAAQALRESELRYRNLFNSIDEGFCVLDMIFDEHQKAVDWRFLDANPSFETLTGMRDVIGKRVLELIPNHEAYWFETYGKVVLTGEAVRFVNEAKGLDGRWFDLYAFPLGGPGSRKVAVLFTNITERKKAEEALRQSEERFRALFDRGPIAMYSCDRAGVIQAYNRGAVELWQREPKPGDTDAQFRGSFKTFLPDGTLLPSINTLMSRVLKGEAAGAHDLEVVVERPDGSHLTLVVNVVPLFDAQGKVNGSISCFYDITERSLLEQQALEQAQALADLDRRKDEFLATLSHELRNPLAALSNAAHLLRLQKDQAPIQHQARAIIERQVGQLKNLVDDLLEVSRISTGRVQLRLEPVAVSGIVERAVETAQPLITQQRHQLSVAMPPEPIWLNADAARLEQVLVNLLTNAAKYTDDGGQIWLSVELDLDLLRPMVVISVRDSGVGIEPDLLPHIFNLFTQADRSLHRSQGGLGIGLSLVQRLVELHGGTVTASSVPGQGSNFVLKLPLLVRSVTELAGVASATPSASLGPSAPLAPPVPPAGSGCRVLLVDDNVDAAQTLGVLLEMSGHAVQLACDGLSAIEAAIQYRPEVMLLDIGLPGLDGYQVTQRIRQQAELDGVVLIALTGYGRDTDRERSKQAGFDHHLVKPASIEQIEEILRGVAAAR